MMNSIEYANAYLEELKKSLDDLPRDKIAQIVDILMDARKRDAQVFVCGNGGSAATASHMVCDLGKGCIVDGKRRFKVIGLNDNIPMLTAWSNDTDYTQAYMEQMVNFLNEGDVVIGISGSGNSPNVLNVLEYANQHGAITVGMTGFQGGKMKDAAKICLVVPSDNMERIEDIHLVLEHLMKLFIVEVIEQE
jgi:D-sedoheptulose 7-phosphate isomerase